MTTEIVALISIFLSATIPAYLVYRQKKIEANQKHTELTADRTGQLVDQLQEEVSRLRDHLAKRDEESTINYLMIQDLRKEVSEFRWGVMKLIRQLNELGEIPVWEPSSESKH